MELNKKKYARYPKDNVSMEEKLDYSYGLDYVKAIWHNGITYGSPMFYNSRQNYWELTNYALGQQSEDKYKPLLKINPKAKEDLVWQGALSWAIKNYATKRVNIVVSKLAARRFDPIIDAVDQVSIDEKAEYRAKLQAYIENKELVDEVSQLAKRNFLPDNIDPELIPQTSDELDVWMATSTKDRTAASLEKLSAHNIEKNKWENIKRGCAFDAFVYGVSVAWTGMDENIFPEIEYCPPRDMIVPFSDREDFSDIRQIAQIMYLTIPDFRKMIMTDPKYSEEKIDEIISNYENNQRTGNKLMQQGYEQYNFDDVPRIPVVRFQFISTDELVRVAKKDGYNNDRFLKKDYYEYDGKEDKRKFQEKYGGERKLYRQPFDSVYEGYWVVNSNHIFNYRLRKHQERYRGNFSESALGYKMFAPNLKNGRVVSTMKQMIPVLDELQSYHIKKMHVIASALPQIWAIDLNALRAADLTWDKQDMTDQDKITFMFQTGIFVFEGGDRYSPGSNYSPIKEMKTNYAQEVLAYVQLIRTALEELDEIIGFNRVTSASTLRPDTLKGTAEIQQQQTEVSLDYLYTTDRYITEEVFKSIGNLTLQSVRYRDDSYYENIIGRRAVQELRQLKWKDYGYNVEPRPTQQQWNDFYAEAIEALKAGQIGFDDLIDLRSIQNLKSARQLFKVRVRRREKAKAQMEQNKIEGNIIGQRESNAMAHEHNLKIKQLEGQLQEREYDREERLEAKKHANRMRELKLELLMKGVNEKNSDLRDLIGKVLGSGLQLKENN